MSCGRSTGNRAAIRQHSAAGRLREVAPVSRHFPIVSERPSGYATELLKRCTNLSEELADANGEARQQAWSFEHFLGFEDSTPVRRLEYLDGPVPGIQHPDYLDAGVQILADLMGDFRGRFRWRDDLDCQIRCALKSPLQVQTVGAFCADEGYVG